MSSFLPPKKTAKDRYTACLKLFARKTAHYSSCPCRGEGGREESGGMSCHVEGPFTVIELHEK